MRLALLMLLAQWPSIPTGSMPVGTNGQCLRLVSNGSAASYEWSSCAGSSDPWTRVAVAGSNVTDNTVAGATNITGLTWTAAANTGYRVRCNLVTSAAAATTGVQVGLTGPASPTELSWSRGSCASTTALTFASVNAYSADARTASAGTTRCVETVDMVLRNGVNAGAVQFTVNTEIDTSTVTVFIGSWCEWMAF